MDDKTTNLKVVQEVLKKDFKVFLAQSGARALKFLETTIPDLILLDLEMPEMSGYDVITIIKQDPVLEDVPVIFLTSFNDRGMEEQALNLGAVDYILKPILPGILTKRVSLHLELITHRKNLEQLVSQKTEQLSRTQDAILGVLANVTAYRDNETGAHILRTTKYVELIANVLLYTDDKNYRISEIYANDMIKSAKLHDIGKVAIKDSILLKPTRLTTHEFEIIKSHTTIGAQMIASAMEELGDTSTFLNTAKEIVYNHHECWDGSGYPRGLKGEEIPISGRIMALADVYDAIVSQRPYKKALSHETAISIIKSEAGTHFDDRLIELCDKTLDDFEEISEVIKDSDDDGLGFI